MKKLQKSLHPVVPLIHTVPIPSPLPGTHGDVGFFRSLDEPSRNHGGASVHELHSVGDSGCKPNWMRAESD